jgi:hypothetical protein
MNAFIAAVTAVAATVSPFGLYHHAPATDLDKPATRTELATSFSLVTVRGAAGQTGGGVGEFLKNRGTTKAFLYRRGTAVSEDDAAALARDHPDWLAKDSAGNVVTSNAGGQVIDITNPAVRDWLVAGVARDANAGAYDGIYIDVLGAFFSARFYSARPVVNGAPLADSAWRDGSVAVIKAVKAATRKPVVANGFGIQNGKNYLDHKADADQLIAAADGIQIEQFARNGNMALDRYKPAKRWREDVDLLQAVGRMGKIVLADTRVRATTDTAAIDKQRTYALASFLVGAEGPARFRFAEGEGTGKVDPSMAGLIAGLGAPRGDATATGDALERRFEGGTVTVDPIAHTAFIAVSGRAPATTGAKAKGGYDFRVPVLGALSVLLLFGIYRIVRRRRWRSE